ncbi:MAG: hypothetical protein DRP25_02310 [Thermotoga sp.]|nr:MAG: hypothetical protein DRP25_02310 [Thermotoga sp.]
MTPRKTVILIISFFIIFASFSVSLYIFSDIAAAHDDSNKDGEGSYKYHTSYESLVADMQNLNNNYPDIFELYTAQDAFGLPDVTSGSETYKTWIIRITNESTGFNKPEVLFIGGHHGDEPVGVEAAYYLAEWLAEHYDDDPFVHYLVDHREIYIMPVVNPYGWVHNQRSDENGIDMNRDYPYEPSDHIFATIGARAVHELTKRHLFINTISWHAGREMIVYAWGCKAHTGNTECPDDRAFYNQAKNMSEYAGPFHGYYVYGRANAILYPCYGAYEDYAYAMSWDTPNADPSWPTKGCYSLTYCVEISNMKKPPEDMLGGREGVYSPGGPQDGYIPKNTRMALLLTDIAEPYIKIVDVPHFAAPGQHISIKWEVWGALSTTETNIQWGTDPDPVHNYEWSTHVQSGGTAWQNVNYTQEIAMPTTPGVYYFVIRAKVDQNALQQNNPDPNIKPQSFWVNMRTNDSWSMSNNGNTLHGHTNWYSEVFTIVIGEDHNPPTTTIKINGPHGNDDWYIGFTVVELHANDNLSGVNYTMYRVNNGEWKVYDGPFAVKEGTVTIEYYSVDYAGNVEETKSYTLKYDKTEPKTICTISGEHGIGNWYRSNVTISFSATDNVSGVNVTWYKIDGGEWHIYNGEDIVLSGEGRHIIEFYSTDVAGNQEDARAKVIYIDYTPPSVEILYPRGGETLSGQVTVRWNSSDNLSSDTFVSIEWSIDGERWYPIVTDIEDNETYNWNTTKMFDGNYVLRITVKDYAGNIASKTTSTFTLNNGVPPPEINLRFVNPERGGIYLFGNKFLPLPGSIIIVIGGINVEVRATINSDIVYIDHVDFYLDDELQCTVNAEPYMWNWHDITFGKHTIRVVAYDILGDSESAEIVVWRLL